MTIVKTKTKKQTDKAEVWEAHRCPRCDRKWAAEVDAGRGNPILYMCPSCVDEIRCHDKANHPDDCFCNFTPPEKERA